MRIGANTNVNTIFVWIFYKKEKLISINANIYTYINKQVSEEKIANIMNNYFINITKNLNLKPLDKNKVDIDMLENHVGIKKYMKHYRILFQRTFTSKN